MLLIQADSLGSVTLPRIPRARRGPGSPELASQSNQEARNGQDGHCVRETRELSVWRGAQE